MGAYRLRNTYNWSTHYGSGHISIETVFRKPLFDMGTDIANARISYKKLHKDFLIGMWKLNLIKHPK